LSLIEVVWTYNTTVTYTTTATTVCDFLARFMDKSNVIWLQ